VTSTRLDLIRHQRGVELPAEGRWVTTVAAPLTVIERGGIRTRRLRTHSASAALVVGPGGDATDDHYIDVDLELVWSADRQAARLRFDGHLVLADRLGRWTFAGTLTSAAAPSGAPSVLRARYDGVYVSNTGHASTWLNLIGFHRPDPDARHPSLHVTGELHLERSNAWEHP